LAYNGLFIFIFFYRHSIIFYSYLYEPKSLICRTAFTSIVNMTHCARRKTADRLHCTFSAIIDILEMENNREPTTQEINSLIFTIGDRAIPGLIDPHTKAEDNIFVIGTDGKK
jgi:hypothetical protein